jgi:hypothetical protein
MSKPILFIGASGAMCRLVIERFMKASDRPFILADINLKPVEEIRATLPPGRATSLKLDLFDHQALLSATKGAALVVLGAGPYTRTSHPVMEACLEAKVPYLDFDDDVESTQAALDMSDRAKKAGVAFFIGCGASPGMNNVLAVDAASDLDTVTSIDLFWLVGNEKSGAGRAVMEHLMHIASGPCLTWINGKPTITESYLETKYAPMIGSSEIMLHETAHPEPVTLPRLYPNADSIRCYGGLYPLTKFGCARGLGNAVRKGFLSINEAGDFQLKARHGDLEPEIAGQILRELEAQLPGFKIDTEPGIRLLQQAKGSSRAASYALEGLIDQIKRGETSKEEVRDFFIEASGYTEKVETAGGLLVRAIGFRNGHPATVIKRTPSCSFEDSYLTKSMGTVTGTSCAAFMVLALEAGENMSGVFCPEDWAAPQAFYKALETCGVPRDQLPETYTY